MKTITALQCLLTLSVTISLSACAERKASFNDGNTVETLSTLQNGPQELIRTETKIGTGPEAQTGQTVTVHYTGWLYDEAAPQNRGKKFDSSVDRGEPFSFSPRRRPRHKGLGPGRCRHESRRQTHAEHPGKIRLRQSWCRCGNSTQCAAVV